HDHRGPIGNDSHRLLSRDQLHEDPFVGEVGGKRWKSGLPGPSGRPLPAWRRVPSPLASLRGTKLRGTKRRGTRTADRTLLASDFRLPTSDSRSPTSDSRSPTSGS